MGRSEREQTLLEASNVISGFIPSEVCAVRIARALVDTAERETAYQARIAELTADVERITASGVENAKRYAADLAEARRSEARGVGLIRTALLAGASEPEQSWAVREALEAVECSPHPGTFHRMSRAYLAQGQAHAEARALLSEIGERALRLLGRGT